MNSSMNGKTMYKKITMTLILVLFIFANRSFAQKKVIDLGDLSIEGDVRKPLMITLQSLEENKKIRKSLIEKEFLKLESELLTADVPGEKDE